VDAGLAFWGAAGAAVLLCGAAAALWRVRRLRRLGREGERLAHARHSERKRRPGEDFSHTNPLKAVKRH
jgi:HAMP domain-containing protein